VHQGEVATPLSACCLASADTNKKTGTASVVLTYLESIQEREVNEPSYKSIVHFYLK
jgi:hypothetical protein